MLPLPDTRSEFCVQKTIRKLRSLKVKTKTFRKVTFKKCVLTFACQHKFIKCMFPKDHIPTRRCQSQNNMTNIEMSVYPNPASAITCIPVNCIEPFQGQISITDVLGKEVSLIYRGSFKIGLNQFFIRANDYAKGMYFIVLNNELSRIKKRLFIQ